MTIEPNNLTGHNQPRSELQQWSIQGSKETVLLLFQNLKVAVTGMAAVKKAADIAQKGNIEEARKCL